MHNYIIVWGYIADCQTGYYGKNCSKECSSNCQTTSECDKSTGHCIGGCKQGWAGNTCDQGT